jgi:hypothetical protein
MKKLLLLSLTLAATLAADAAEKKRVVVCTVTQGFRHSSIPFAEKTIEKLGAESGLYEVVAWSRQPDVKGSGQRPLRGRRLVAPAGCQGARETEEARSAETARGRRG